MLCVNGDTEKINAMWTNLFTSCPISLLIVSYALCTGSGPRSREYHAAFYKPRDRHCTPSRSEDEFPLTKLTPFNCLRPKMRVTAGANAPQWSGCNVGIVQKNCRDAPLRLSKNIPCATGKPTYFHPSLPMLLCSGMPPSM